MESFTLSMRHAALHRALDDALVEVLARLIDRDLAGARAALARFESALTAHVHVEEQQVMPLLLACGPADGPRSPSQLLAEHRLLERSIQDTWRALDALSRSQTDRADGTRVLVDTLPVVYRLRALTDHHRERELALYPQLDGHADADALARALEAATRF